MLEKKTKMLKKKVNSPIFLWNMIPGTYTHKNNPCKICRLELMFCSY